MGKTEVCWVYIYLQSYRLWKGKKCISWLCRMSGEADYCSWEKECSAVEATVAVGDIYCYTVKISLILQLAGEWVIFFFPLLNLIDRFILDCNLICIISKCALKERKMVYFPFSLVSIKELFWELDCLNKMKIIHRALR